MKHTYLFVIFLFFLAIFCGCEKIRTPKLYGTWELISFEDTTSIKYTCQFTKDGHLYSFENDQKIDSCEYIFYVENLRNYLKFSHDRIIYFEWNGLWEVVELKKTRMALITVKTPGQITREFSKVD